MSIKRTTTRKTTRIINSIDPKYKSVNISFIERINQICVDTQKFELYQLGSKFNIKRTNSIGNEYHIDVDIEPDVTPYVSTLIKFLNNPKCNESSVFQLPKIITELSHFRIPLPDILNWANTDISTTSGKAKLRQIILNCEAKELELILRGNLTSKQFPQIRIDEFLKEIDQSEFDGKENHKIIIDSYFDKTKENIVDNFINNVRINSNQLLDDSEFNEKRDSIIFAMIENVVLKNGKVSPDQFNVIKSTSSRLFSFDEEFLIDTICLTKRDLNAQSISVDRKKQALRILDSNYNKETIVQKAINDGIFDKSICDYNDYNDFELNDLVQSLIESNTEDFDFTFRSMGENSLLTTKECGLACLAMNGNQYVIVKNIDYLVVFDEEGSRYEIDGVFSLFGGENDALFVEQKNLSVCDELARIIGKKQEPNGVASVFYAEEL